MPADPAPDRPTAAVILAGGTGSRLGGADKPALRIDGTTLLERALLAVGEVPTIVVGPPRDLPPGVIGTRERPPGGGPAAALVAGLRVLFPDKPLGDTPDIPGDDRLPELGDGAPLHRAGEDQATSNSDTGPEPAAPTVVVLAADLPAVTSATISRLATALRTASTSTGGALLVDPDGRPQWLAGVWRVSVLRAATRSRHDWNGRSLREFFADTEWIGVPAEFVRTGGTTEAADIDTPADLARWTGRERGHGGLA